MRNLATIKTISDLLPIEGRDRIELAIIDGWQVIVKKEDFEIGGKCVFCEIDSILPEKPEFEFLRSKKFRIKTMKMGGVLSQGICFPLSILPEGNYELEDDVTDIIGIKKYEPNEDNVVEQEANKLKGKHFQHPIFKWLFRFKIFRTLIMPKKMNKGFPSFIQISDEPRCQNMPWIFNNKEIKYVVREKLDGCSITVFLRKLKNKWFWQKQAYDFGVCSRTVRLWNEDNGHYWFVAKKYNLRKVLEELIGDNEFIAIQGEVLAPRVQGNKYKVKEPELYVFNLIYPNGKMPCSEAEPLLAQYNDNILWCPLIETDFILPDTVNELLDYATEKSVLYDTLREGVVLRNYNKNISFKAVSPDFLIKHNE